jgi:hypothetical protein
MASRASSLLQACALRKIVSCECAWDFHQRSGGGCKRTGYNRLLPVVAKPLVPGGIFDPALAGRPGPVLGQPPVMRGVFDPALTGGAFAVSGKPPVFLGVFHPALTCRSLAVLGEPLIVGPVFHASLASGASPIPGQTFIVRRVLHAALPPSFHVGGNGCCGHWRGFGPHALGVPIAILVFSN